MVPAPITPEHALPVCIVRDVNGEAEVLCEAGTNLARVFTSQKSAKRWIKRNVLSPAERRKLYFVPAPRA